MAIFLPQLRRGVPQLASYPLQWEGPGNKGSPGGQDDAQRKMVRGSGAGDVDGGLRGIDGFGLCRAVLRLRLRRRLFERLLRPVEWLLRPADLLRAAGRL